MGKIEQCMLCKRKQFTRLFSSKDRMLGIPGKFFVKKCTCGLIFLDPAPNQNSLKMYYPSGKYYAYNSEEDTSFFGRLREFLIQHYYKQNMLSKIVAAVIHNVPAMPSWKENGKILDVGCGTGDTLLLLKKLGWNVYGFDIDKMALKIAKKRGITHVFHGSYEDIARFPDNYFDAVRLYHVIEHLDKPDLALRIIRKKLKKYGELILGTPNVNSITARLFGKYWLNLDSPRHIFLFAPNTLRKLLVKEKYDITSVDFCSGGGIVGSIGYALSELLKKKINLVNNMWLVLLFYPVEWIFDKFKIGDIFVMNGRK